MSVSNKLKTNEQKVKESCPSYLSCLKNWTQMIFVESDKKQHCWYHLGLKFLEK